MGPRRLQPPAWLLLSALGVAAWVVTSRLIGVWPLDIHLRDDAYYYFCWARSLLSGDGPCVTAGVATSGVQIAWAIALCAVALVTGSAVLPVASVVLGALLHVATAVLIGRSAGVARGVGVVAGCVYAGSPFLMGEAINGQATALACFALAVFCTAQERGGRAFFWSGLLVVGARCDLFFLVVAAALVHPRRRASRLVLSASILACLIGVDLLLAGDWLPDSARPIPWLMAAEFAHTEGSYWERFWAHAEPILRGVPFRNSSTPMAGAWLLVAWLSWRRRENGFLWLLLGALAFVSVHYLWRYSPRDYYFAPLGVIGALALVRLAQLSPRAGFWVLLLGVVWNGYHLADPMRTHAWQREMSMAGRFVGRFLPPVEDLGCFNSGLVTWHHEGRVVNLDGVVNRPAFTALRKGELWRYLEQEGVRFVLDNPVQFASRGVHSNGRHFGSGFDAAQHLVERVRFWWPAATDRGREGMAYFGLFGLQPRAGGVAPEVRGARDRLTDLGPIEGGPVEGGRVVAWRARPGETLEVQDRTIWRADAELVLVVQVVWDGRETLRLFVHPDGGARSAQPLLVIAPE